MAERATPWLVLASFLAFGFLLLVLLPLAAFRRSRAFAAVAMLIVSYVFGATVWMEGKAGRPSALKWVLGERWDNGDS